jgi:hypothetical protein
MTGVGHTPVNPTPSLTLVDLRRLAIRKQSKIRFALKNGMECVVCEDGIARVPALKGVPDFNLEAELASATDFVVEAVVPAGTKNAPKPKPVSLGRSALAAMTVETRGAAAARDEHDDE